LPLQELWNCLFADAVEGSDDDERRNSVGGELHKIWYPGSITDGDEFFKTQWPHSEPVIEDTLERHIVMVM
jgi:hypothetical protein